MTKVEAPAGVARADALAELDNLLQFNGRIVRLEGPIMIVKLSGLAAKLPNYPYEKDIEQFT